MRFIIGLGSGRCGTTSLAQLLHAQPGVHATHEFREAESGRKRVTYKGKSAVLAADGSSDITPCVDDLTERDAHVSVDVSFYNLYYVDAYRASLGDVRFVSIRRDRAETVDSYMRWTPNRNHWNCADGRANIWDRCYPNYDDELEKEDAIARYYDMYYERATEIADYEMRTEDLNDPSAVRALLSWVGINDPVVDIKHANKGSK